MTEKKRKRINAQTEDPKPRKNTPLLFLVLLLVPLFGGYYNFSVLLAGVLLIPVLLYECRRSGALCLPVGPEAWCLFTELGCVDC